MTENSKNKVLLIEDSKSFSTILRNIITKTHGFEVDVAETFEEAKRLLHSESEYFVAIVDYHLPDAPNGEAIEKVIENKVPTIVFTGTQEESLREELWQKGITDYANKRGTYNLEYVVWMVKRIHQNRNVAILVIDDSPSAREMIKALLETQCYKVYCAESGEEGLHILKQQPHIQIAIVDTKLEGMDGLQVAAGMRETHARSELEIIGISAYGGRSLAAQFIKSGASDFILKPLIPEEFLSRVNNSVDRIESYLELEKLNQLKNQFLGTAAHDIRGPLGSIKTAADFLLKRSPSAERTEKLLHMVSNSSSDLLQLLETLLDISVIESGEPSLNIQHCKVSDAVQERLDLYQSEASNKNIVITQAISDDIDAELDILKFKQVVDNLITNAIKYSEHDSEIFVRLESTIGKLRLSVQDSGPGITSEEQKELFKAFTVLSTKATAGEKKTGLGLAITKSIVDAHKGKITYTHDDTCHSTFTVELPLHP